ncbi:MAG: peptidylprolyl isomerase [Planctomycetes bacterium]|nr:peptidylprolyl isomerase [Planctomycetota bacterium]
MQSASRTKSEKPAAVEADTAGRTKLAQAEPETDTPTVGLDGSSASDGAPATPNAPGIGTKAGAGVPGAANRLASVAAENSAEQTADSSPRAREAGTADANRGSGSAGAAGNVAANGKDSASGTGTAAVAGTGKTKRPTGRVLPTNATGTSGGAVATADLEEPANKAFAPLGSDTLTNLPTTIQVEGDGVRIEEGVVVATVNGEPIFLDDVLRDIPQEYIQQLKKNLKPEQFREWRRREVDQRLQRPVEELLLLQALRAKLKPEQLKEISRRIDEMFNKEILPKNIKEQNCQSEAEFEQAIRKNGWSIDILRTRNRNRELAQQFIMTKVAPKANFERIELLKYYNEHKETYAIPAQVKWEQITLKFSKHGGKEATRKKAEDISKRLAAGESFTTIARENSNGPNASKGGSRGWTPQGILANDTLNNVLLEQPLGVPCNPVEEDEGITIIRVVDRQAKDYKPFAAVQEDIKANLKTDEWAKASKALFEELEKNATIIRKLDEI